MRTVYNSSMYGKGMLLVTPGKDVRDVEEFFKEEIDADGVKHREFRLIPVKFADGSAEVSDELAQYLIAHGHATSEPEAAPAQSANEAAWQAYVEDGRPKYPKPIAVGTPLRREDREYIADHPLQVP